MASTELSTITRAYRLDDLNSIAAELIESANELTVWLVNGDMGAGKTTLVKAICKHIQVKEVVSSPTFSIINEYRTDKGQPVYHFDFYRLKKETEAYDLGVNEYFDSGDLCLVEWSEKIPSLIPDHYFNILIENIDSHIRSIHYARY
jgi:tRNA threonylcarbamoyladenosine biosynthesis protein TsaE